MRGSRLVRRSPPFDLEKRERDGGEDRVMGPPAIAPAFEVVDPEFVFQFPVLLFDGPPAAHQRDQLAQGGGRVEVEQIVCPLVVGQGPLAQEPALAAALGGPDAHRRKAGGQGAFGALAPRDPLPLAANR